ncbi:MAG: aldo/keto reductase [Caldilineaceae bacterium]|nr:aldo/keto reductase [Caldilineaceae bacterium]
MSYRRCGRSGLRLPVISLGGWHNFTDFDATRQLMRRAFDLGITHFDLANNYGPPPGIAEEMVGKVLQSDFASHRDELIISTKAGYHMWPGPYGEWGSKKYLVASLHQSLKRLQLDYVDIFYSHRFDPNTPLEETMGALDLIVRQGKALYAGISNYDGANTCEAARIMEQLGTPITIHQPKYSMFHRPIETDLLHHTARHGIGVIAFSPLAQGLLSDKYLAGIPSDSRAGKPATSRLQAQITPAVIQRLQQLNQLAATRGQSLAQLALVWALRDERVTSLVIGASRVTQIEDNVGALSKPTLTAEEIATIEAILAS